jgi:hypothetical protein
MTLPASVVHILERIDLAGWLPLQATRAPAFVKAAAVALLIIVPGLLTASIVYLIVRRFVVRRRSRRALASVPVRAGGSGWTAPPPAHGHSEAGSQ